MIPPRGEVPIPGSSGRDPCSHIFAQVTFPSHHHNNLWNAIPGAGRWLKIPQRNCGVYTNDLDLTMAAVVAWRPSSFEDSSEEAVVHDIATRFDTVKQLLSYTGPAALLDPGASGGVALGGRLGVGQHVFAHSLGQNISDARVRQELDSLRESVLNVLRSQAVAAGDGEGRLSESVYSVSSTTSASSEFSRRTSRELAEVRAQVEAAEEALDAAEEEAKEWARQYRDVEDALEVAKAEAVGWEKQYFRIQFELDEVRAEFEGFRAEQNAILQSCQEQLRAEREGRQTLRIELDEVRTETTRASAEKETIRVELEEVRTVMTTTTAELSELRTEHASLIE